MEDCIDSIMLLSLTHPMLHIGIFVATQCCLVINNEGQRKFKVFYHVSLKDSLLIVQHPARNLNDPTFPFDSVFTR